MVVCCASSLPSCCRCKSFVRINLCFTRYLVVNQLASFDRLGVIDLFRLPLIVIDIEITVSMIHYQTLITTCSRFISRYHPQR